MSAPSAVTGTVTRALLAPEEAKPEGQHVYTALLHTFEWKPKGNEAPQAGFWY